MRFLAVLELFKQGAIDVEQGSNFGDIEIIWLGDTDGRVGDLATVDAYEG